MSKQRTELQKNAKYIEKMLGLVEGWAQQVDGFAERSMADNVRLSLIEAMKAAMSEIKLKVDGMEAIADQMKEDNGSTGGNFPGGPK